MTFYDGLRVCCDSAPNTLTRTHTSNAPNEKALIVLLNRYDALAKKTQAKRDGCPFNSNKIWIQYKNRKKSKQKTVCPYHWVSVAHVDAYKRKLYIKTYAHTQIKYNGHAIDALTHTDERHHKRQLACGFGADKFYYFFFVTCKHTLQFP